MSAYSEKPSTVEVRGLFFTSQEENEHLTFWPSESDHHAPELFRNIHYLKAMKDDPSNQLIKPSQNIVSPEQWEKSSKKIIEKLYKMQVCYLNKNCLGGKLAFIVFWRFLA